MGDAASWDERYRSAGFVWSTEPNSFLPDLVEGKRKNARGRIALSGGDLRSQRTGRRLKRLSSCESGRNLGAGAPEVKETPANRPGLLRLRFRSRGCR